MSIIPVRPTTTAPRIATERSRRTQTRNHLKQIGIALHGYHERYGTFPSGWIGVTNRQPDVEGESGWGWAAMILPDLDQQPLFAAIDFHQSPLTPVNEIALKTALPVFRSPSNSSNDRWDLEDGSSPGTVFATSPMGPATHCLWDSERPMKRSHPPGIPPGLA